MIVNLIHFDLAGWPLTDKKRMTLTTMVVLLAIAVPGAKYPQQSVCTEAAARTTVPTRIHTSIAWLSCLCG